MSLRGRHSKASFAPTVRFLIVTIGGAHFALHADRIQGLLTLEEAAASPALASHASRIELAARLGLRAEENGPETRIVLVSKGNHAGHLLVSEVHGLQELEPSQVLPLPRHFRGEEQRWYQGMILFADRVAVILNPAWVLEGCESREANESLPRAHEPYVTRPAIAGGQG
jgi:hypothetical protein